MHTYVHCTYRYKRCGRRPNAFNSTRRENKITVPFEVWTPGMPSSFVTSAGQADGFTWLSRLPLRFTRHRHSLPLPRCCWAAAEAAAGRTWRQNCSPSWGRRWRSRVLVAPSGAAARRTCGTSRRRRAGTPPRRAPCSQPAAAMGLKRSGELISRRSGNSNTENATRF